jgi:hypothetical protein
MEVKVKATLLNPSASGFNPNEPLPIFHPFRNDDPDSNDRCQDKERPKN